MRPLGILLAILGLRIDYAAITQRLYWLLISGAILQTAGLSVFLWQLLPL